jgi:hypothetical protein
MVKVNGAIIGGIISQKFKVIQKNHINELRIDVRKTIKIPNIPNCRKKIDEVKVVVETVNAHNPEDSFSDRFINLLQK